MLLIFAGSALANIAPHQWDQFYSFWYVIFGAALMTGYVCFGRKNVRTEVKLLEALCLWFIISRILNGDLFLAEDGMYVFNIAFSCLFFPVCMVVPEDKRKKVLDAFAAVATIYCLFGAILGIHTAITGKQIVNPFTEWYFSRMDGRLELFETNYNASGNWFFSGIFFLIYLFFRCKNPIGKVLAVLAALAEYTALALTANRSSMLGFAVSAALLAALPVIKYLKIKKTGYKVLALLLTMAVAVPAFYSGFAGVRYLAGSAAVNYAANHIDTEAGETEAEENAARPSYIIENLSEHVMLSAETEQTEENVEADSNDIYKDDRGFEDSGRLKIYKTAIMSLKDDPARILRGCMSSDIMSTVNPYYELGFGHMHNSYLQTLHFAGLPGFLLAVAFTVLVFIHAVKLYFSESIKADMAIKSLVLFLPGMFIYNMLETSMFAFLDLRSTVLFLAAGAVVAYSYEICPPGVKKHK